MADPHPAIASALALWPDTVCVLASALATRVGWRVRIGGAGPVRTEPWDELPAMARGSTPGRGDLIVAGQRLAR